MMSQSGLRNQVGAPRTRPAHARTGQVADQLHAVAFANATLGSGGSKLFAPLSLIDRALCCCWSFMPVCAFSVVLRVVNGTLSTAHLRASRRLALLRTLWTGGSAGSRRLDHLQPEQGGDITIIKQLGCRRCCFLQRNFLSCICEQFVFVDTA